MNTQSFQISQRKEHKVQALPIRAMMCPFLNLNEIFFSRGSITRSLKATEHIRAKAKFQLDEDFRSHQQDLDNRKRIILKKLSTFGNSEQKDCRNNSEKVNDCIHRVKNIEEKFNSRLSNYNPMTDPDFNELCQNYIDYSSQLNQLNEYIAQPDKIDPIVYIETSNLKTSIKEYGNIQFGEDEKDKEKTTKN